MTDRISYRFCQGLRARQAEAERSMLEEFARGEYTLEKPFIRRNPYLINPLSAVIGFRTREETAVTVTVLGKRREGTVSHTFPKSREHLLPVLGLYGGYDNQVELRLYEGQARRFTIATEELGEGVPSLLSLHREPEYICEDLCFFTPSLGALATAFDAWGEVRWHLTVPVIFEMTPLKNGNFLIGTERVVEMPYYVSGLYEMTMMGKIVKEYAIPGGFHHDQLEMEDGNILALTEGESYETVEDMVVLLDRKTGEIRRTWDLKNCLTPGEGASGGCTPRDWFHGNALFYDPNTHSITLSGRHVDAIVNIDYDTGELNWILGDPETWPADKQSYFFARTGEGEFDWPYEQHGCLVTPDGGIMCFDNGHYRSKIREKFRLNKDSFSRGVLYRIDRETMTIEQLWQYGKERGEEFFSSYIGNVAWYGEDHYLVHSGGIQYDGAHASERPAALYQRDPRIRGESITVEVFRGKVIWEMKLKGNFYRARKLLLYHEQENLPLGEGSFVGRMGVTPEFGTQIPAELCKELLPARYEAELVEEEDRFVFQAVFEGGQVVMLMLENESEEHGYFISTAKNKFNALCCGAFIKKDPRNITLNVNKAGLWGVFDVRVIVDGKKYETGIRIACGDQKRE
ncbi:MAG: aryl-sulfate sulfotransferase [Lachnospiraceae bacterium]|jgi:arylsulfate sulfotransferase|nr:aryl-sulfate sulfotransferase [Lachnospiraceae bacterium]